MHDNETDNIIGSKLTTLREAHNLSKEDLAERSGCSVETITQIEEGVIVPSLSPLIQITRSLGVRLGTLLDDDKGMGPSVTRAGEAEETTRLKSLETGTPDAPLDFFSLAQGKPSRHMDPFMIDVAPNTEPDISTHEGEEFIYVMKGEIEIEYGKDTYHLNVGDSIYYDSIVPHQVRGHGDQVSRILAVVYTPA